MAEWAEQSDISDTSLLNQNNLNNNNNNKGEQTLTSIRYSNIESSVFCCTTLDCSLIDSKKKVIQHQHRQHQVTNDCDH